MNPLALKNNGEVNNKLKRPREEDSAAAPSSLEEVIIIKIVSAFYGPCEGGQSAGGTTSTAKIPYTRDVTPILRALLQLQESKQSPPTPPANSNDNKSRSLKGILVSPNAKRHPQRHEEEEDPHMVRLRAIAGGTGGMKRTSIPIHALHDGWNSMNIVFGDACPGTSKKLYIHYVIFQHTQIHQSSDSNNGLLLSDKQAVAVPSEVHHVSFSEYDPVILRRHLTFYQDETSLQQATARVLAKKSTLAVTLFKASPGDKNNSTAMQSGHVGEGEAVDDDEQTLLIAQRMGRSQSITDFAKLTVDDADGNKNIDCSTGSPGISRSAGNEKEAPPRSPLPRLRSATFEIVLPMILSFLQVRERVQCRLVCRLWRNIVRDWGVASIIDSTDPTYQHAFTRPFLRGILTHSYSSLHSLRLSDFHELRTDDLHPSLPHLRKLRVLDISRCTYLNDRTMQLLAKYVSSTLEVLYIKGLTKVSDTGVSSICKSCRKLTVLDVSNTLISDETGILIGELTKLRALYMRDNFRVTNKSIDAICANCTKLNQLVLWGCVRLEHLTFDDLPNHNTHAPMNSFTSGRLVSLSLWGCYSLRDDVATALGVMTQLRSLIVSECHRLTDQFAIGIAQNLPQLNFLYMRYCKRLTDSGVNAIANAMENLYSLDLSFCTKITSSSISNLLELRHKTLSELRLMECRQLQIARDPDEYDEGDRRTRQQNITRSGRDGQSILKSLKSPMGTLFGRAGSCNLQQQESNLSMLDVRCCGGQPSPQEGYPDSDPFVRGMVSLKFEQRTPGFFARPARWNETVEDRLLKQLEFNNRF